MLEGLQTRSSRSCITLLRKARSVASFERESRCRKTLRERLVRCTSREIDISSTNLDARVHFRLALGGCAQLFEPLLLLGEQARLVLALCLEFGALKRSLALVSSAFLSKQTPRSVA